MLRCPTKLEHVSCVAVNRLLGTDANGPEPGKSFGLQEMTQIRFHLGWGVVCLEII